MLSERLRTLPILLNSRRCLSLRWAIRIQIWSAVLRKRGESTARTMKNSSRMTCTKRKVATLMTMIRSMMMRWPVKRMLMTPILTTITMRMALPIRSDKKRSLATTDTKMRTTRTTIPTRTWATLMNHWTPQTTLILTIRPTVNTQITTRDTSTVHITMTHMVDLVSHLSKGQMTNLTSLSATSVVVLATSRTEPLGATLSTLCQMIMR